MPGLIRSPTPLSSSSRCSSEGLSTPPQYAVALHPEYYNRCDEPYYSWTQPTSYSSYPPEIQQPYVPSTYYDEDVDMIDVVNDKVSHPSTRPSTSLIFGR